MLVGINLLREGLDLPEVALVAVLDADKEGFLRSETSLIQTAGRAARNLNGRVIFYADSITGSMERALDETRRRRERQAAHNLEHGIEPKTILKDIHNPLVRLSELDLYDPTPRRLSEIAEDASIPLSERIAKLEKQMKEHAQSAGVRGGGEDPRPAQGAQGAADLRAEGRPRERMDLEEERRRESRAVVERAPTGALVGNVPASPAAQPGSGPRRAHVNLEEVSRCRWIVDAVADACSASRRPSSCTLPEVC